VNDLSVSVIVSDHLVRVGVADIRNVACKRDVRTAEASVRGRRSD